MATYEINSETLAIVPKNESSTYIYEKDGKFIINESSNKIMEESCEFFGSSLEGRKNGTVALTGITHKVPIIVEESNNIIFFPTSSPRLSSCSWISLNNIVSYKKDKKLCKINFVDDKSLKLNTSYGIINNQILRASRLQMMLDERKRNSFNKNEKKDKTMA
jgi:competence protein ComK